MQEPSDHEQLTALLDGELNDAEVAELEHRLARDADLRAEFEGLKRAVELLRTRGPVQAPPSLLGDVLRRVEAEPAPGGWSAWLRRPFGLPWAGLAVAGAAMAVVGISVATTSINWDTGESGAGRSLSPFDPKQEKSEVAKAETAATDQVPARGTESGTAPPLARSPSPKTEAKGSQTAAASPGGAGTAAGDGASATSQAADPRGKQDPGSGTADPPALYPVARHRVSVSPGDLETIARLYAKYGARSGSGNASDIAKLGRGDHTVTLDLRDTAARNAFLQELQRQFGSAYVENTPSKDTLTLDATRVDLQVFVNDYVPDAATPRGTKQPGP